MLAIVGVPLAVAFHGGVGALFSTLSARPFWHTPLMPILFLTGALVSGGALMAFVVAALYPHRDDEYRQMVTYVGRAVLGLLIFDVVLEWAEFSVPMWYGVGHEYDLLMRAQTRFLVRTQLFRMAGGHFRTGHGQCHLLPGLPVSAPAARIQDRPTLSLTKP